MDGYGLHYYVRGTGTRIDGQRGSATEFDESEWFALMKNTLRIDELIQKSKEIMDKHDPEKRVGLYVDEWGTWWDEEEGTKEGFLYQQNTLRDAVSAGIFLNTFNNQCDRVKMANIAQINNVLQAMILTKGEKMLITPTYHVFEMFKVHQGATMLPNNLTCNTYQMNDTKLPALNVSASKDAKGVINITICNLDPTNPAVLDCQLKNSKAKKVTARVLTAKAMDARNTFENPNEIEPTKFEDVKLKGTELTATLPPKSVVLLQIR